MKTVLQNNLTVGCLFYHNQLIGTRIQYTIPWADVSLHLKWHLEWFGHFSTAQHTDTQTMICCSTSVATGHIYTYMRGIQKVHRYAQMDTVIVCHCLLVSTASHGNIAQHTNINSNPKTKTATGSLVSSIDY